MDPYDRGEEREVSSLLRHIFSDRRRYQVAHRIGRHPRRGSVDRRFVRDHMERA